MAGILLAVFAAMQFIRPAIANPPVRAELAAPPEVRQILRAGCYNCHSNETRLRWFDQIAPAYWLVAHHVEAGRRHLNFSELGSFPAPQQKAILFEAVNQIRLGAMPLESYQFAHPEARLTRAQVEVLENWLAPAAPTVASPASASQAAAEQYETWIHREHGAEKVSPALNGIAFLPDYRNWRTISSTNRFDNHTLRAVLGNDVAIRAIAANQINPWPDGTMFAKVAWDQLVDERGGVRAGAFRQVEFMIKDGKKYASTLGWGWARWLGTDLKPYGKDAEFSHECVGCHKPLGASDYVFTTPMKAQQ